MTRIRQAHTRHGGAWSRRQGLHPWVGLLGLVPGLAVHGCDFASAPSGSKDQCQRDDDCVEGWHCSSGQFCVPAAAARDSGAPIRFDGGPPPVKDGGTQEVDLSSADAGEPAAEDATRPDGGSSPADHGRPPTDLEPDLKSDAEQPRDAGLPDAGTPAPDQGVECGSCPLGEVCNRFGLCAVTGQECADATDCPLGLECGPRSTCAPAGQECAEADACADPALTCNAFGSCVPHNGGTSWCTLCGLDLDCGGPEGICFDARYQDGEGRTGNGHCSAHCPDGQGCPSGFECRTYSRQGRGVNVCVIRAPSCEAWLTFNHDCGCPAEGSFCEDLQDGSRISFACTYACDEDGECPPGAICDSTWWHWNGFCRIP